MPIVDNSGQREVMRQCTQEKWNNLSPSVREKWRTINYKNNGKLLAHLDISDKTKEHNYYCSVWNKRVSQSVKHSDDTPPGIKTKNRKIIPGDEVNSSATQDSKPVEEMQFILSNKWKDLVKECERYPALKDFSSWTQQRWDETSMIQKIGFICMVETYRGDFSLTISPDDTEKLLFQMERFGYTEYSHVFGLRYLEYLKQRGKNGIIFAIIDPDREATTNCFQVTNLELLSQAPVVKQIVEEHLESFGSEQWNQLPEVFQLAVLYYIDQRLTQKCTTSYDAFFDRIRDRISPESGFFRQYQDLHPCSEESYAIEEISRDTEADEPIDEEDISISNVSTPQNSMRKESEHVNLNSTVINDSCSSPNELKQESNSEPMPPIRPQESADTTSLKDEINMKRQSVEQEVSEHARKLAEYKAEIETLKRQVNDHNSQLTRHKCFEVDCNRQISFLKKENGKLRVELDRTTTQSNDELDKTRNQLNDKLINMQTELDDTRNQLNDKLVRTQTELIKVRNECAQLETRLEQVESRMEQTELIVKDYEVRLSTETNIVVQSLIAHLREVVMNGKS
jgi:hypothetical protein